MSIRSFVLRGYAEWLRRRLPPGGVPEHVALIMDGNRRWARQAGFAETSEGHRHGAAHLEPVARWCAELGIRHLTVWVASVDNIRRRDPAEVAFLMQLAETTIAEHLAGDGGWRVHLSGQLDLLPDSTVQALKAAEDATRDLAEAGDLTLAIGYSGRREFLDAVRTILDEAAGRGESLADVAAEISEEQIDRYLDSADRPYPNLVIRTSGEQRLSDFLLWQAADSELYFVDAYWPAFRQIDLLRALRSYAARRG